MYPRRSGGGGGWQTLPWGGRQERSNTIVFQPSHNLWKEAVCSSLHPKVNLKGAGRIESSGKHRVGEQRWMVPACPPNPGGHRSWRSYHSAPLSWGEGTWPGKPGKVRSTRGTSVPVALISTPARLVDQQVGSMVWPSTTWTANTNLDAQGERLHLEPGGITYISANANVTDPSEVQLSPHPGSHNFP